MKTSVTLRSKKFYIDDQSSIKLLTQYFIKYTSKIN